jgi:hypothetical protein
MFSDILFWFSCSFRLFCVIAYNTNIQCSCNTTSSSIPELCNFSCHLMSLSQVMSSAKLEPCNICYRKLLPNLSKIVCV